MYMFVCVIFPRASKYFPCALLSNFDACFPNAQGHDDTEHRSGSALCERHTRQIAALASYCHAEHTQSIASVQSGSSGPILQGKLIVEDGANARCLFLLHSFRNIVLECIPILADVCSSWFNAKIYDKISITRISGQGRRTCMPEASRSCYSCALSPRIL